MISCVVVKEAFSFLLVLADVSFILVYLIL